MRKRTLAATVLAALATLTFAHALFDDPPDPWWTPTASAFPPGVETILGDDLAAWQITDRYGRPVEYTIEWEHGRPLLPAGDQYINVVRRTRLAPGTEIEVTYRMADEARHTMSFQLDLPTNDVVNLKDRPLWFTSSWNPSYDFINLSAYDPNMEGESHPYARAVFRPKGNITRSLAWPERLRKIVEHELAALPKISETWLSVRYVLREDGVRVYANDSVLLDCRKADLNPEGMLRIAISPGVELRSVLIRRVGRPNPVYEPVRIDAALNAAEIEGGRVSPETLPGAHRPVLVQDVPFVFPESKDNGDDHIDLGESWFQQANLEGHLGGHRGPMGGRWQDAFVANPARIQFRAPAGRYRALHLIAAADDGEPAVPHVTAQFYRPLAGFPESFSGSVPQFSARAESPEALPVRLQNGRERKLYHVTIPIEPGRLAAFDDVGFMAFELTKDVQLWRAYPDPSYYSFHAAGLPSSVHVYAATLERPAVDMQVEAGAYCHIWTQPEQPSFTVHLTRFTDPPREVELTLDTTSYDGQETTSETRTVKLDPGTTATVKFVLSLKQYGFHHATLRLTDGEQVWNEIVDLAYLHEDSRARGDWEIGRGPIFGFWNSNGGHHTPPADRQTYVMALAGAESRSGSFRDSTEAEKKVAEEFGLVTFKQFTGSDHWITSALVKDLKTMSREDALAKFVDALSKIETKPSKITKPRYISFFAEPQIGPITYGNLPDYWGDPEYRLTDAEQERFDGYLNALLAGAPVVKKRWPNAKIMMPHGDPFFTVCFMRNSEEARKWIDGIAYDNPVFERLPEQQIHQVAIHRLYEARKEFAKFGKDDLLMPMYEGPCQPSRPGGLTPKEQAFLGVRDSLVLLGYGIDQQLGGWCPFEAGGYWGEQHYGGGICKRLPWLHPKPQYAAFATMTRHLNRRNFTKWIPTGSLSTFAMQFKHYKTGEPLYVVWTVRGMVPVTMTAADGAQVAVYDMMDNATQMKAEKGLVTFVANQEPRYVEGLPEDTAVTLGPADHSDVAPAAKALRLANLADGRWRQSAERDPAYEDNNHLQIHRFPGRMSIDRRTAPAACGGQALAVHLEEQDKERYIMPYYTTLVPRRPIEIPGKASHIGLWVRASSDWGRVVYSLRDAEGERWVSIGTKEQWNCDDTHNWSVFCFDGWRYLRFEMPSHSPYDTFREHGTTWWGSFEEGDGIVDLPLRLEKIMVERRSHVVYVNDLVPANRDDVLLGNLYAEYVDDADRGKEAVRLSHLRMPIPREAPELDNPIARMRKEGEGAAPVLTGITLPEQMADGTRCYVNFNPVEGASQYDVWVSPYIDGRGAVHLGKGWKEPGKLVTGLRPAIDFYVFLVYTDAEGKVSKPSAPLKIRLKDIFAMK